MHLSHLHEDEAPETEGNTQSENSCKLTFMFYSTFLLTIKLSTVRS